MDTLWADRFWDKGYLGLSANTYQSNYGTVAEADVTIKMKSDRYTVEGEIRQPFRFIENIKTQISTTDYQHTEYLDNVGEAVFDKSGTEIRIYAKHENGPVLSAQYKVFGVAN